MSEPPSDREQPHEYQVEREGGIDDYRRKGYEAFMKGTGATVETVYYPACGQDATPSLAFPEARIYYVDPDPSAMAGLHAKGIEGVCAKAEDFLPDRPVDVLILMNDAGSDYATEIRKLKPGGHILSNDWLGTATHLHEMPGVTFLGIASGDGSTIDADDLESCFIPAPEKAPPELRQLVENKATGVYLLRDVPRKKEGCTPESTFIFRVDDPEVVQSVPPPRFGPTFEELSAGVEVTEEDLRSFLDPDADK